MRFLFAFFMLLTACSTPTKRAGTSKGGKTGLLTLVPVWIKDKAHKYDVQLHVQNESNQTLLFFVGDMRCTRGSNAGDIHMHSDNRVVDLRPQESRNLLLTCDNHQDAQGDFVLTISKVFDNPSNDSRTPGKVLAEGLTWQQSDHE
jgi:hypothetical protein